MVKNGINVMLKINDWAIFGDSEQKGYVVPTPGRLFRIHGYANTDPKFPDGLPIKTDFVIIMTKLPNEKYPRAYTLDGQEFLLGEPEQAYKEFLLKEKGII